MTLRVMTYNILRGGLGREHLLREVLEAVQPDVVVFEEASSEAVIAGFAKALNANYYFGEGYRIKRLAVVSRLPILAHSSPSFLPFWRILAQVAIEHQPGQQLHIFGVHTLHELNVVTETWRTMEARYILSRYRPHQSEPCLLTGDFNAIAPGDSVIMDTMPFGLRLSLWVQGNRPYHFAMRQYLNAGFTDCFRKLHPDDPGYTLPSHRPNSRLDYMLANPQLAPHLKNCFVVREPKAVEQASDHCPVVAEFEF